nr:exocyst complex component sec15 [Quercus suber]
MYPLVCIDIRNFLNQIYLFSDDHFRHTTVIDRTLKENLDELLVQKVARTLVDILSTQYLGQIVQILTNLDHFERACTELEGVLVEARSSSSAAGPITLSATAEFNASKKRAEKRIFELVNSKIDQLIGTAEYDWTSTFLPGEVSQYMQELTRYLGNTMDSVLLGLPDEIKEQIYFEALAHISKALLILPLDPHVRTISAQAAGAYRMDVGHLVDFVKSLRPESNPDALLESLEELRQTTELMGFAAEGKGEVFFDISKSKDLFSKVDKLKGPELLEKVMPVGAAPTQAQTPVAPQQEDTHRNRLGAGFGGLGDRLAGQFGRRDRS